MEFLYRGPGVSIRWCLGAIAIWTDLDQSASVDQVGLLLNLLDNSSLDLCGIHGCDFVELETWSRDVAWAVRRESLIAIAKR